MTAQTKMTSSNAATTLPANDRYLLILVTHNRHAAELLVDQLTRRVWPVHRPAEYRGVDTEYRWYVGGAWLPTILSDHTAWEVNFRGPDADGWEWQNPLKVDGPVPAPVGRVGLWWTLRSASTISGALGL